MSDSAEWIGRGTWLVDRRDYRHRLGVITEVDDREDDMSSRLGIQWRSNCYQNIELAHALEHLKNGDWGVDHGK
jgi:hypothetical protein